MTDSEVQLATLKKLCPNAELWTEGSQPIAFLPGLRVAAPGGTRIVDALLCPHARDGYPTRLFLSEATLGGRGGGWTQCYLQGRTWHTRSWASVPADLPWLEMLGSHLRAFQ